MKRRWMVGLVAGFIVLMASAAYPQGYPNKPVMMLVAFAAGGATDVGARIVSSIAEKELGQPIVVLNKVGAGGQVGWTELSRQKPDGYYIGFIQLPFINAMILETERKTVFNIDSFTPIITQVLDPGVIYVKPDSPYKSLKDLIHDAQRRPGEIKVGTTGLNGDDHLAILMVEEAAKAKLRIVHFDGDPSSITALLGGQIDVSFLNVGGLVPRVKAGQIIPLAVMDKERTKFFPEVLTTTEQGYPTVISSSTRGIVGPKGIPEPIVQRLQAVFRKAMEDPEHLEKMDKAGLAIKIMTGEDYRKYMLDMHERVKKLMDAALKTM
jgi:tripartite-type tricarboxylate transporter receptor subunit TctC